MNGLTSKITRDGDTLTLTLSGELVEYGKLPTLDLHGVKKLIIDTAGLIYLNSFGVRDWIYWTAKLKQVGIAAEFTRLSHLLITHMNHLGVLLPYNARVSSAYVSFHCTRCEHEENTLFNLSTDLPSDQPSIHEKLTQQTCPDCGAFLEPDGDPSACAKVLQKLGAGVKPPTAPAA